MTGLVGKIKEGWVRKSQHLFLFGLPLCPQQIFHIHGIGVTNGNARLEPTKLGFPGAAKGIGSGAEAADILLHGFSVAKLGW
jgi:hypothetical protein